MSSPILDDERSTHGRPGVGGTLSRAMMSLALLLVAGTVLTIGSLALFSDQAIIRGDGVGTGTVDLAATPATAVVSAPAIGPGEEVTSSLELTNSGSLEVRYAATSTTTENALAAALRLTVKSGVTACDAEGWAADGTVLYAGPLGATTPVVLFGDIADGSDAGDRVLAAGGSESLCLNVRLPVAASADLQGVATSATFDFVAEQTVNNP